MKVDCLRTYSDIQIFNINASRRIAFVLEWTHIVQRSSNTAATHAFRCKSLSFPLSHDD